MGVSSKVQVRASIRSARFWAPHAAPIFAAGGNRPRDVHYPGGTSAGAGGTRRQNRAGDSESRVRVWRNKVRSQGNSAHGLWARRVGGGEISSTLVNLCDREPRTLSSVCYTNYNFFFFSWSFSTIFVIVLFSAWGASDSKQTSMEGWENE